MIDSHQPRDKAKVVECQIRQAREVSLRQQSFDFAPPLRVRVFRIVAFKMAEDRQKHCLSREWATNLRLRQKPLKSSVVPRGVSSGESLTTEAVMQRCAVGRHSGSKMRFRMLSTDCPNCGPFGNVSARG